MSTMALFFTKNSTISMCDLKDALCSAEDPYNSTQWVSTVTTSTFAYVVPLVVHIGTPKIHQLLNRFQVPLISSLQEQVIDFLFWKFPKVGTAAALLAHPQSSRTTRKMSQKSLSNFVNQGAQYIRYYSMKLMVCIEIQRCHSVRLFRFQLSVNWLF